MAGEYFYVEGDLDLLPSRLDLVDLTKQQSQQHNSLLDKKEEIKVIPAGYIYIFFLSLPCDLHMDTSSYGSHTK
jgi:hypothetical protein